MSVPAVVDASIKASLQATPNNYGVTHIGIDSLPDNVLWTTATLVRKYSGYPQNLSDGTAVHSISNPNTILKVASVYGTSPISAVAYTGGGTVGGLSTDYVTYTAVPATGGTGNGATFDVIRSGPSVGGIGSVISVTLNCGGELYTAADVLTIAGTAIGGSAGTHDVSITVKAVGSSASAGVKTVTVVSFGSTIAAHTNVLGVAAGGSLGKKASFTLTATGTATVYSGGSGFSVNDYISVPGSSLGRTSKTEEPNEYGIGATYHLYDVYGDGAYTTNPTSTVSTKYGGLTAPTRAYYSLFLQYATDAGTLLPTQYYWKKAGEISSPLIANTGVLDTLISHLPKFYTVGSQNGDQNDLIDFLSLFAFQLEIYKNQASDVFFMHTTTTTDEELIKLLLKQYGSNYSDVLDLTQARTLLNNLIKVYQGSGSVNGTHTAIEAYAGYNSDITSGRNNLQDYNSASFEDATGFWYPTTDQTTYPTISHVGPIDVQGTTTTAAFTDSAYAFGTGLTLTNATCATSSTTVTVDSTAGLKPGVALSVSSGTGVLASGTIVSAVTSTTTFKINQAPTTGLSSATLKASTNLVTGMSKVLAANGNTTASFYLGPKKVKTTATSAAGASTVTVVSGNIPAVNDYIMDSGFPSKTYVTGVVTTTGVVTLSSTTSAAIAPNTELWFSKSSLDKAGAASAWMAVNELHPYAFSIYVNAGGIATTTTSSTAIYWYDRKGTLVSSSAGATSVTTTSANNKSWLPLKVQAMAPVNAAFAEPRVTVAGITSSTGVYLDAAQWDVGVPVVSKQVVSSTTTNAVIEITTANDHNMVATDTAAGTNYVVVTGVGYPFDGGPYAINSIPSTSTLRYNLPTVSLLATTAATAVNNGLVASNTPYEDVRLTYIDVLPDRINLLPNPSFEGVTVGTATNFWAGTGCAIAATNSHSVSGTQALKMTSSGTAAMHVDGYGGSVTGTTVATSSIAVSSPTSVDHTVNYIFSFYTHADSTARNVTAQINWSDGSTSSTTSTNVVNQWTRHSIVGAVPFNATSATVTISIDSTTGSEVHYVDDALFEYGFALKPYFDGNFDGQNYASNGINIDSMWEYGGVANACRSHYYYNRWGNLGRLKSIITDGLYYA